MDYEKDSARVVARNEREDSSVRCRYQPGVQCFYPQVQPFKSGTDLGEPGLRRTGHMFRQASLFNVRSQVPAATMSPFLPLPHRPFTHFENYSVNSFPMSLALSSSVAVLLFATCTFSMSRCTKLSRLRVLYIPFIESFPISNLTAKLFLPVASLVLNES
jgi:hypothetical protein